MIIIYGLITAFLTLPFLYILNRHSRSMPFKKAVTKAFCEGFFAYAIFAISIVLGAKKMYVYARS